jgi:hypothetical protein
MANQRRIQRIIALSGALNCQIFIQVLALATSPIIRLEIWLEARRQKRIALAALVLISRAVHELAEFAIGWRQAIVHPMLYRL